MKYIFPVFICVSTFFSCDPNKHPGNDKNDSVFINPADTISPYRNLVKTDPVAEYTEKVDNAINDWHFSVKLFETKKTFYYLIKMQYEEVQGQDTLKLPNLGALPRPALIKGKDRYSCVLGFIDVQNKFNEYKLVRVESGNIKLTTLKHFTGAVYRN
jgi:hypothetical protein